MPDKKLQSLYEDVSKDYEVGSIADFETYLSDPVKREQFFNEVVKPNYEVKSLDEFENVYGLKKKVSPTSSNTGTEVSYPPTNAFKEALNNTSQSELPLPLPSQSVDEQIKIDAIIKGGKESLRVGENITANQNTQLPVLDTPEGYQQVKKAKIIQDFTTDPAYSQLTSGEKKDQLNQKLIDAGLESPDKVAERQRLRDEQKIRVEEGATKPIDGETISDFENKNKKDVYYNGKNYEKTKVYHLNDTDYAIIDNGIDGIKVKFDGNEWVKVSGDEEKQLTDIKDKSQQEFFDTPQNVTKNLFTKPEEQQYVPNVLKYLYDLKENNPAEYNYISRQILGNRGTGVFNQGIGKSVLALNPLALTINPLEAVNSVMKIGQDAKNMVNAAQADDDKVYQDNLDIQRLKRELIYGAKDYAVGNKEDDLKVLINRNGVYKISGYIGAKTQLENATPEQKPVIEDYINSNYSPAQIKEYEKAWELQNLVDVENEKINYADKNIVKKAFDDDAAQRIEDARAKDNYIQSAVDIPKAVWNTGMGMIYGTLSLAKLADQDNEYGAVDKWADTMKSMEESMSARIANRQFVNKETGEIDGTAILPGIANAVASMYVLNRGAKVAEMLGASYSAGVMASSFAMSHNSYRKAAERIMPDQEATNYALRAAIFTSTLELISPMESVWKDEIKKIVIGEGLEKYAKGESLDEIFKPLMKTVIKESAQEGSQDVGDRISNGITNTILGKDVLNTSYSMGEFAETMLFTAAATILTGGIQGVSSRGQSRSELVNTLASNPTALSIAIKTIQDNADAGLITDDKALKLTAELTDRNKQLSALPESYSPPKKAAIVELQNELASYQKNEYELKDGQLVKKELSIPEQEAVKGITTQIEDLSGKDNSYFDNLKRTEAEKAALVAKGDETPITGILEKEITPEEKAKEVLTIASEIPKVEVGSTENTSTEEINNRISELEGMLAIDNQSKLEGKGTSLSDRQGVVDELTQLKEQLKKVDNTSNKEEVTNEQQKIDDIEKRRQEELSSFESNPNLLGVEGKESLLTPEGSIDRNSINAKYDNELSNLQTQVDNTITPNEKAQSKETKEADVLTPKVEEVGSTEKSVLPTFKVDGIETNDESIKHIADELVSNKQEPTTENIISNIDAKIKEAESLPVDETFTEEYKKDVLDALNETKSKVQDLVTPIPNEEAATGNTAMGSVQTELDSNTPTGEGIIGAIQDYTKAKEERKENVLKHFQFDLKSAFISKNRLPKETIGNENFIKLWNSGVLSNANGTGLNEVNPQLIKEAVNNPQPFIDAYNEVNKKYAGKNGYIEDIESAKKELLNTLPKNDKTQATGTAKEPVVPITDVASFKAAIKSVLPTLPKEQLDGLSLIAEQMKNTAIRLDPSLTEEQAWKLTQGEVVRNLDDLGIGQTFKMTVNGKEETVRTLPEVTNGFYSPIEKRLLETKIEKQSVNKWKAIIGSGDEAKWTGVSAWLNTFKPDFPLTKKEILQHMKDNRIQVVEVVKQNNVTRQDLEKIGFIFNKKENGQVEIILPDNGEYNTIAVASDTEEQAIQSLLSIEDIPSLSSTTKFSQYVLPGEASNYKEILVTLPLKANDSTLEKLRKEEIEANNEIDEALKPLNIKAQELYRRNYFQLDHNERLEVQFYFYGKENDFYEKYRIAVKKADEATTKANQYEIGIRDNQFKSPHFDEPNVLVHIRTDVRTDNEGNKVLFVEEIQSDWGQKGKKEGFANDAVDKKRKRLNELESKINRSDPSLTEADEIEWKKLRNDPEASFPSRPNQIPMSPFVTETNQWVKLGLKTAIREAVKEGVDKVVWSTGEQQNERYDLSKVVDKIQYFQLENGRYSVYSFKDGISVNELKNETLKTIEDTYGKEIAEKIKNNEHTSKEKNFYGTEERNVISGVDLKLGGKGMKGFYGSPSEGKLGIVGSVAESMFGKGSVKTSDIKTADNNEYTIGEANYVDGVGVYDGKGDMVAEFDTKSDANKYISEKANSTNHSIEITPKIRAEVEQGLPLFQKPKESDTKGAVNIVSGKVHYSDKADVSTLIHEPAHLFLGLIDALSLQNNAEAIAMQRTVDQFAESEEGQKFAKREGLINNRVVARQELFARSAEKYFMEGKRAGFSGRMTKVFEQFKTFLSDIYKGIKNSPNKIVLSPEMRSLFDTIYGKEKVDTEIGDKIKGLTDNEIRKDYLSRNNDISLLGKNEPLGLFIHELLKGKFLISAKSLKEIYPDNRNNIPSGEFQKRKILTDAHFQNQQKEKKKIPVKSIDEIAHDIWQEVNSTSYQENADDRFDSKEVRDQILEAIHDHVTKNDYFNTYQKLMDKALNKTTDNSHLESDNYADHLILEQESYDDAIQNEIEILADHESTIADEEWLNLYNKYSEEGVFDAVKAEQELPVPILNKLITYVNETTTNRPTKNQDSKSDAISTSKENTGSKSQKGFLEKELDAKILAQTDKIIELERRYTNQKAELSKRAADVSKSDLFGTKEEGKLFDDKVSLNDAENIARKKLEELSNEIAKEKKVLPTLEKSRTQVQQADKQQLEIFNQNPNENNKKELSLQKITDHAKRIITGKEVLKRFSQDEQRGIAEGGQIHAEASFILATENSTNGTSNSTNEEQEDSIEKYAKEKGVWIDNVNEKYGPHQKSGEESLVWADDSDTVTKSQNTFLYSNLQEKLDSITLQNSLFPEAPIKVIRFGRNAEGDFQVIVEQPFIEGDATKKVTNKQILELMESMGFENTEDNNYANSQTLIEDLHTGNAILTPEGRIVIIDPIIRLNTPEQGYGGTREVGSTDIFNQNPNEPRKSLKELLSIMEEAKRKRAEEAKGGNEGNVPPTSPKEPVIEENDGNEARLEAIKNFKPITGDEVLRDAAQTYVDQIGENADMPSVKDEFQQRLSLGMMVDMISDFIFKGGEINDIAKLLGDEKIDLTVRGLIDSAIRELVPLGVVEKRVSDTIAAQYSIKLRGRISDALNSLRSSSSGETITPIQQSIIYASIGKDFGSELEKVQAVLDEINNGVPQKDGSVKIFNNDELVISKEQISNLEKQVSELQKELEAEKESNKVEPVVRKRQKEASSKFKLIKENLTNKYGAGFLQNLSDKIEKIKC